MIDEATFRDLTSGPGQDTRLWVSVGLVDADTPQSRSVQFTDADGGTLPFPLVNVTLQPSGLSVACRVGMQSAGTGEGEWHPFVGGDEVLVVVPHGDEREGCVIVARLAQGRDSFPPSVAGADPTTNTVAMKRVMPPFILESGNALLFRVASVESYISLDPTGNVTLVNGDGHNLALTNDMVTLATKDTSAMLQLNPSAQQLYMQAGATSLLLDSGGASALLTEGQLSLVTSGGGYAPGHAVTLEQVVNLLNVFLAALCAPISAVTSSPGVPLTPTIVATAMEAAIPAAKTGSIAAFSSLITAALEGTTPDPTGAQPGIARPGLLF